MKNFIDTYCWVNHNLTPVNNQAEGSEVVGKTTVYEVFKVIEGIPMFIEDHLARLHKSFEVLGFKSTNLDTFIIKQRVAELCRVNQKPFGNMELNVAFSADGELKTVNLGFIQHNYPTPEDYKRGIDALLLQSERENPNAKVKDTQTRKKANELIANKGVYEVILVNHADQMTEGSRSNFFLIQNNKVYTAPEQLVLCGITRKYVLKAISELHIEVCFEAVNTHNLSIFDAAFICGTSPGVMPVAILDAFRFNVSNVLLTSIMGKYNQLVSDYLEQSRRNTNI